ncbi:MAG: MFS transporter [Gammaproteobacteria bacterium]|nr:MFS transporter [Gammaproteobacteria bacterium]NNJ94752.1 MFS transporter [Halobacteria archaeon]
MIYWRLSGFYLFYFAALGALVPYWGLYLKSLGFDVTQIGQLIAILLATKIVAPNVWGWIADHTGQRMAIVRMASLLAVIAFAGVYLGSSYWWLAGVMTAFSFFWNAALPQFEATTMTHLGNETHRYSGIRLWGSVGFIITVALLGPLLDAWGIGLLPAIVLALFVLIWISSIAVPESAAGHLPLEQQPLRQVLQRPLVLSLLTVCFLMQASHGPYYAFYTLYLGDAGYSTAFVGQLWALGVVAEIGAFLLMPMLLPRFGARRLLLVAVCLTLLRWLLIAGFVDYPLVIVFAQTLHAASFGLYHAVAIFMIHMLFTGAHQGRGQALYSSISFGAGGAAGSLVSGYLWTGIGPQAMYLLAAAISLVATAVVYFGIRGVPDSGVPG